MRLHVTIVLAAILSIATSAIAQDVASAVDKTVKDTGHVTAKAAKKVGHGTESGVKSTAKGTGHIVKETGHGVKKGIKGVGHGLKKASTTTPEPPKLPMGLDCIPFAPVVERRFMVLRNFTSGITAWVTFGHPAALNQAGNRMVPGKSSEHKRSLLFRSRSFAARDSSIHLSPRKRRRRMQH